MTSRAARNPPTAKRLPQVFLLPGTIHIATRPTLVTTILGSCIAVCVWDRVRRLAGMNHFVLPDDLDGDRSLRYGDAAVDGLVEGLLKLGCRVENLRAKVLGGAAVLPAGAGTETVGERNLEVALGRLRHYGVPVVAQRTGGDNGRLVRLNTATGEVTLRKVISNPLWRDWARQPTEGGSADSI
jgi:chemotaxis protein CheD